MNGVPTMKILLCIILLSASLSPALSLTCYVCRSTATNEECNKDNQTCPEPLDTCMTIVDVLGISKSIVKQCASRATCLGAAANGVVDEEGNGSTINCCSSSNFCNHSGADTARVHAALWLLPLLGLLLLSH